jgi:hypothetical protein
MGRRDDLRASVARISARAEALTGLGARCAHTPAFSI